MSEIINSTTLVLGGVYKTSLSNNIVRVIAFDEEQVYYDDWWQHSNNWGAKNYFKKKYAFFRTSPRVFLDSAEKIREDSITGEEFKLYRPDLPFSICRNGKLNWTNDIFSTVIEYENYLLNRSFNIITTDGLDIPKIMLVPLGFKGAHKKGVVIEAINSKTFSFIELLWHAQNIQAPFIRLERDSGSGLHRLGFVKGMPSYYIGGYYDNANLIAPLVSH